MEWIPISGNAKVQPGWIYLRNDMSFHPPKEKLKVKMEETPCTFRVEEITCDLLKSFHGKGISKSWEEDSRSLKSGQTYKLLRCSVSNEKYLKDTMDGGINFEYVSKVLNVHSIIIMVKYFYKNNEFLFENINHFMNSRWKGCSVNFGCFSFVQNKIDSVKIYYGNEKEKFCSSTRNAFIEIIDELKCIKKKDQLEPIKAYVNKLQSCVVNQSELMCGSLRKRKESRRQSYLDYLFSFIPGFHDSSSKLDCHCEEQGNKVQTIAQAFEQKEETLQSTYRTDYCNLHNGKSTETANSSSVSTPNGIAPPNVENKRTQIDVKKLIDPDGCNETREIEKQSYPEMSGNKNPPSAENKIPLSAEDKIPPSAGNKDPPSSGNKNPPSPGNKNPPSSGNKNPHSAENKISPSPGNKNPHSAGNKNSHSAEYKIPPSPGNKNPPSAVNKNPPLPWNNYPPSPGNKNPHSAENSNQPSAGNGNPPLSGNKNPSSLGGKNHPSPSPNRPRENPSAVTLENKKEVGTKSNFQAEPECSKKNLPAKKIKLEKPYNSEVILGFKHHYYDCKVEIKNEESKTILLIGSDDCGKLSLLNLVWNYLSMNSEMGISSNPIVDISSKISHPTFVHFGSFGSVQNVQDLVIIVTPELNNNTLESLKQCLNEGSFNVHALGFVFASHVEVLTSEERSFFSYLRSSFGEVSNHHLLTFVTHCDFSRNFPIIEEMKTISVRSRKTFEFRNPDVDLIAEIKDLDVQNAVVKRDFKCMKKVLQALKDLSLLSVKSMKMAQEKSYIDNHLTASTKGLEEELGQCISLVESGGNAMGHIPNIWKLAKLVTAMEGSVTSEKGLIEFVSKSLIKISPNKKLTSKCLFLLVLCCPERNVTKSLTAVLKLHFEIYSDSYVDPGIMKDVPTATTLLNDDDTAILFCNQCKDIHICQRDTRIEKDISLKCMNCECHGSNCHSLWTFQDAFELSRSLCKVALKSLREIYDELCKLSNVIDFPKYLSMLSEIFPKYERFLQDIKKVNC